MPREVGSQGENRETRENLLKTLLELSSVEASLHFKLATKLEEARTETIRLSGLLSMCELKERSVNRYRAIIERMIDKYVIEVKHENTRQLIDKD
ncbi:MAG: hypothetical protein QXE01_02870 [Sulfolobales archaeon]